MKPETEGLIDEQVVNAFIQKLVEKTSQFGYYACGLKPGSEFNIEDFNKIVSVQFKIIHFYMYLIDESLNRELSATTEDDKNALLIVSLLENLLPTVLDFYCRDWPPDAVANFAEFCQHQMDFAIDKNGRFKKAIEFDLKGKEAPSRQFCKNIATFLGQDHSPANLRRLQNIHTTAWADLDVQTFIEKV